MGEYHVYDCSCPICSDERRKLKAIRGLDESISDRDERVKGDASGPSEVDVRPMVRFLLNVSAIRDGGDHADVCDLVGVYCPDHHGSDTGDDDVS